MGGGMDGILHINGGSVWDDNVPYVNGDNSNRKLNLNSVKSDWNENYEFAVVRQSFHSTSLFGRGSFFLLRLASHLPSIRPIESSFSANTEYLPVSKAFKAFKISLF